MSWRLALLGRAAECQRLMDLSADPRERATLQVLRDIWTMLGNQSESLSARQVSNEIAAIEEIESVLATLH
jgi:hypothetical protein